MVEMSNHSLPSIQTSTLSFILKTNLLNIRRSSFYSCNLTRGKLLKSPRSFRLTVTLICFLCYDDFHRNWPRSHDPARVCVNTDKTSAERYDLQAGLFTQARTSQLALRRKPGISPFTQRYCADAKLHRVIQRQMRMSHEIGQNSEEIIQTDNRSSAHSGHANYKCLNKKKTSASSWVLVTEVNEI